MKRDSLAIPIAIVVAAGLIAGAIYMNGARSATNGNNPVAGLGDTITTDTKPVIRPVDKTDHIRGNPNAPIMLVEYSDFECPFCKQFHETMNRIIEEYGPSGKVAWVYRQFPLAQLHPNAPTIAEASECVYELGGDPAFWEFTDLIFESRPINDATEMSKLPEYAATAGVDTAKFQSCLASGKYGDKIKESVREAAAAGGKGTPHTLVLVGDQSGTINGAQPYETVKQVVDSLIKQMSSAEAQ